MSHIILDTCALIWWTLDPDKLSEDAKALCDRIPREGAKVSSASIWEIGLKQSRGQMELGCNMQEYCRKLQKVKIEVEAIEAKHWLQSLGLDWQHRDPVDRLVVALAQQHKAPLVTKDAAILAHYPKGVW